MQGSGAGSTKEALGKSSFATVQGRIMNDLVREQNKTKSKNKMLFSGNRTMNYT